MDDLTHDERQILIDLLSEAIRESHFPMSPRAERLRAIRDKLQGVEHAEAPERAPPRRKRTRTS